MGRKFKHVLPALGLWLFLLAGILPAQRRTLAVPPMQGHTTTSSLQVWLLFHRVASAKVWLEGPDGYVTAPQSYDLRARESWRGYVPLICKFAELPLPDARYSLRIEIDGDLLSTAYPLTTFAPNQAQNFSFLTGSCSFIGTGGMETVLRPPITSRIFSSMAQMDSDFMLWLGDNVYYVNGEWNTRRRRALKNIQVRTDPRVANFVPTRPNYAIWDDHDFGPNDSDSRFEGKDGSLETFLEYWPLPATGTPETKGLFYTISHQDADFFLLDDRYYRLDSAYQQMLGPGQMAWLKAALKSSTATFKFVAIGSQVLNDLTPFSWYHFKEERADFFAFLAQEQIEGVIFLSGDRHFSELLKQERGAGQYPFYEFTCSPLTAWVRTVAGRDEEATNPMRVEGTQVLARNFGKVAVTGPAEARKCTIETYDEEGNLIWRKEIEAAELKYR